MWENIETNKKPSVEYLSGHFIWHFRFFNFVCMKYDVNYNLIMYQYLTIKVEIYYIYRLVLI